MGWNNPPVPWAEFERKLSGGTRAPKAAPAAPDAAQLQRSMPAPDAGAGSATRRVPYAELHAHSNFSFLDGASSPEDLLRESARLGLHGLAITDHDGLYGIVRLAEAAEQFDIATVFGAELSLGLGAPQNGVADPEGSHLLVLARGEDGYHRLAAALTAAQLAGGEKGRPVYDLTELAERAAGQWSVLTGCRKGRVRQALGGEGVADATDRERAAEREVRRLVDLFGADRVLVELIDQGYPLDSAHNDALA
ncbi:MAG TPA: PHP domain-containing protein, partial [Terrimesophilobacter sp.]|nr:PHP domain-containing protein [Terrimesophilobacter sp.]